MDLEHEQRLTEMEARAKSNTHRLDKLEPVVEEIHNMSEAMVEMATELKYTNKSIVKLDEKVDRLESEPADKWNNAIKMLMNAVVGGIGAAVVGGMLWALSQSL